MLLLLALAFPAVLIALMLAMEHVERLLERKTVADQVAWMLHSELPAEQVESQVAQRVDASLSGSRTT